MKLTKRQKRLIWLVMEEGSEIVKERSKIARSGEDFVPYADQGKTATNLDNFKLECVDQLVVLMELMLDDTLFDSDWIEEASAAKIRKLLRWEPGLFDATAHKMGITREDAHGGD